MSDAPTLSKQILRTLVKSAFILACFPGLMFGYIWYANAAAERDAKFFCNAIPLGSNISSEIRKFENNIRYKNEPGGKVSVRHYGYPDKGFSKERHTFLFNGFMFEKAYCVVSLNSHGKVVAKDAFMQFD